MACTADESSAAGISCSTAKQCQKPRIRPFSCPHLYQSISALIHMFFDTCDHPFIDLAVSANIVLQSSHFVRRGISFTEVDKQETGKVT
jgi:hypothetical protein